MRTLFKDLAFSLLDRRRTRGYHLMMDLRYWLKSTHPDGVVLDVGANEGAYAREFRRYLKRPVYAFEPVRETFSKLQASTAADGGIAVFQIAMGDKPGTAEISINPQTSLVSSLRPNQKWHSGAYREPVPVSTVDLFVQQHSFRRVAVLKLDVEGYELEALMGATTSLRCGLIDFLVLETAFLAEPEQPRVTIDQLISYLLPLGFEPWGVYDCELLNGDRGGIGFMNVVFGKERRREGPR